MNEKPIILITDPEKQLIEKNGIEIYDYDDSHLYYNACDLGALKEIANLKLESQQLKIQISAREEECRKLEEQINEYKRLGFKHLQDKNKKLEDNWSKLKEYIDKTKIEEFEKLYGKRYGKTFTQAEIIVCNMIKDKMQELERGSSSDE